jgi:hypothetical protein
LKLAIALCIILSYYRITNRHINITQESSEAFLSISLILTIGNSQYTIFTPFVAFFTFFFSLLIYLATIGVFVDVIPGAIWYYYNQEDVFVRDRNTIAWYFRMEMAAISLFN